MQAKWNGLAIICGFGLGMSAAAQTEPAAQPVPTPETVQAEPPIPVAAAKPGKWTFDVSIYGLAPAMSGDVTVKGIPVSMEVDFDQIWDNLDSCAMGSVRIGRGRWALLGDLLYMGLEGSADWQGPLQTHKIDVEFEQWLASVAVGFQATKQVELLAGMNYNNMNAEISGGPLGNNPSGTQEWFDPFVGTDVNLPLTESLSLHARADVGGFGVGSDLTWQAFPYASWRFAPWGSLQAGYRWLYADYEDGSGTSKFGYDVTTQGPQLGITGHF